MESLCLKRLTTKPRHHKKSTDLLEQVTGKRFENTAFYESDIFSKLHSLPRFVSVMEKNPSETHSATAIRCKVKLLIRQHLKQMSSIAEVGQFQVRASLNQELQKFPCIRWKRTVHNRLHKKALMHAISL